MRRARSLRLVKIVTGACIAGVALIGFCSWRVARTGDGHAGAALVDGAARDVAIVPGTFARRGRPGSTLRARLEAARVALADGRVRAILISGDENAGEVTAMRAWLEQQGVARDRILAD